MPFSVLLLTAASSKRSITGVRGSKVVMEGQPRSGEVVLFFQMDRARTGLQLEGDGVKCCDGLIFRSHDNEDKRTICLVEMKTGTFNDPAEQIIRTHEKLSPRLANECSRCSDHLNKVRWIACIYSHTSSQIQTAECKKKLKDAGFREIFFADEQHNDIGAFLRGEDRLRNSRNRRR